MKQTVYYESKVENIRIQTDFCNFFPLYNQIIEFSFFQNTYWHYYIELLIYTWS